MYWESSLDRHGNELTGGGIGQFDGPRPMTAARAMHPPRCASMTCVPL